MSDSKGNAPADDGHGAATTDSEVLKMESATIAQRLRAGVLAAICIGALVTAGTLSPRSTGYGTHRQMGMPGCSMMVNTGWPCPGCGVTTSVAAAVHGDLAAAFKAQPFGIVLVLAAVVLAVTGLYELISGRRPPGLLRLSWWHGLIALGAMLAGWAIKLHIGAANGTFPVR